MAIPASIPSFPVPCWDSAGAEAVSHYELSLHQNPVLWHTGIGTNYSLRTKPAQNSRPELTSGSETNSNYFSAICPPLSNLNDSAIVALGVFLSHADLQ